VIEETIGDRRAVDQHQPQPVGQKIGGGRRYDDEGDEQDRADGIESGDGGGAGQRQQRVGEGGGREAERAGQRLVEGRQFQLLEEKGHESEVDKRHSAHRQQCLRHRVAADFNRIKPDEADLAEQHGMLVDMHVAGIDVEQQYADGKQDGEDEADGGVILHAAGGDQQFRQEDREDAGQRCADDLHRAALLTGQHPDDNDAEDDGMADRVGQHGIAAQHQEGAEKAGGDADQRAGQHDHRRGIVEQGGEHGQASCAPRLAKECARLRRCLPA
jgi:hypothetical protein